VDAIVLSCSVKELFPFDANRSIEGAGFINLNNDADSVYLVVVRFLLPVDHDDDDHFPGFKGVLIVNSPVDELGMS
jgi:hypothetical protein